MRGSHERIENMDLPANREVVLDTVAGSALEIIAEIDPRESPLVELNLLRSPDREEFTRVAFFKDRGFSQRVFGSDARQSLLTDRYLLLIGTAPDVLSRAPETAPVLLAEGELLELRVFVDRSVIEVFANGRQCLAVRVYPERADSTGVSLRAQGSAARLRSLDAWQMNSIWE